MAYSLAKQIHSFIPWLLIVITFTNCASSISLPTHHNFNLPKPGLKSRLLPEQRPFATRGRKLSGQKTYFYNQTIDHFGYRPKSYDLFSQRVVIIDDYWGGAKANAPMFVYLGAEASIDGDIKISGLLVENAPLFGALVVFIEHRYYGMSNPSGSMIKSLDDSETRGYFSSAQALADYAEVILFLKQKYQAQFSPVIVFGGSYGGMLATWFRLKYPHVAMGALASSAPIFMTTVPPDTYDNWVDKVYKDTSENCYNTIKSSWAEMVNLGSQSNGLSFLSQKFNTCSTLKSTDDLGQKLINLYRRAAQYDAPPRYPVSQLCDAIDGASTSATNVEKVAIAISSHLFSGQCFVVPSSSGKSADPAVLDETTLGWSWQTCSELVDPMGRNFNPNITNKLLAVDPFDLETFVEQCTNTFGVPTRPLWLQTYYGAPDLKLALKRFGSNIIFSNGLKDPFSQEGVLESISDTLVAIKTANGSHCLDLHFAADTDPDWLTAMRKEEVKIMKEWLSVYYEDLRAYLTGN